MCYDVASDSHYEILNYYTYFNNGNIYASKITAYDLFSSNPKIIFSSEYFGGTFKVNYDGSDFQIISTDQNTFGVSVLEKQV